MLNETELAEIGARCESATPGKWKHGNEMGDGYICRPILNRQRQHDCNAICLFGPESGEVALVPYGGADPKSRLEAIGNSVFIAHAHQDIPALLQHIAELEALRAAEQSVAPDPKQRHSS